MAFLLKSFRLFCLLRELLFEYCHTIMTFYFILLHLSLAPFTRDLDPDAFLIEVFIKVFPIEAGPALKGTPNKNLGALLLQVYEEGFILNES